VGLTNLGLVENCHEVQHLPDAGRVDRWDRLIAKASIDPKIAVNRKHVTVGKQLAHPHDAGVRQIHALIGVLLQQTLDRTYLLLKIECDGEVSVL